MAASTPGYQQQLEAAVEQLYSLVASGKWMGDYGPLLVEFTDQDQDQARQDLERANGRISRQPAPRQATMPEWLQDRFDLVKPIGRGGMATVYLATDREAGQAVAVKVIHEGQNLARFRQEAALLQEIDSPHIVRVRELIESEGSTVPAAAIVLDYIEGPHLGKKIRQAGQDMDFFEIGYWMSGIAQAMVDVSRENVTHRDIKPANILVRQSDNAALLTDFGLATDRNPSVKLSVSGMVLGTACYMAPEQSYESKGADVRSDIYGFGATFYHVCTGTPPHVGDDFVDTLYQVRHAPLASPLAHNPDIPPALVRILETALAKSPRDRYQGFEAISLQLNDFMEQPGSRAHFLAEPPAMQSAPPPMFSRDMVGMSAPMEQEETRERKVEFATVDAASSPVPTGPLAHRRFSNGNGIQVVVGDIIEKGQTSEVLVSSDDGLLRMAGGVALRIRQAAGDQVQQETQRFAPVQAGRVIATSAGDLPQRMIFHAITLAEPVWASDDRYIPTPDLIRNILDSCCYHIESSQVQSIIFPLLGTGIAGMDATTCLQTMLEYLVRELETGITPLQEATIVIHPADLDELDADIEQLL